MNTTFNKKKEYGDLIADKVADLQRLCHMHKIPMFITLCVENNSKKTEYVKEMVSAATCGIELTDNQIAKHVNVSLGFDTIQPSADATLDMEDVDVDYIEDDSGEGEETDEE